MKKFELLQAQQNEIRHTTLPEPLVTEVYALVMGGDQADKAAAREMLCPCQFSGDLEQQGLVSLFGMT